jgi:hypothetical protein
VTGWRVPTWRGTGSGCVWRTTGQGKRHLGMEGTAWEVGNVLRAFRKGEFPCGRANDRCIPWPRKVFSDMPAGQFVSGRVGRKLVGRILLAGKVRCGTMELLRYVRREVSLNVRPREDCRLASRCGQQTHPG